jgi:hypothetical protein
MKIPQAPKKLRGTFWGLTTFFNPAGYKNKYENYKIFLASLRRQGLKLLTIELSFNNKFEIKDEDAEMVLRLKGNKRNMMWQKERMLNIGLKKLPKDCDRICWLDADIIFKNENWVSETASLLEKYPVVQPFAQVVRLRKGVYDLEKVSHLKNTEIERMNVRMKNMAKKIADSGKLNLRNQVFYHGHSGFGWAARREIFEKIGFYDKNIVGSGDLLMAFSFYFDDVKKINSVKNQYILEPVPSILEDYFIWAKKAYSLVKGSVYYTPGLILHLWHGDMKSRGHNWRYDILTTHLFDLKRDIILDDKKLFAWAKGSHKFYEDFESYFYFRSEENRSLLDFAHFYRTIKVKILFFNKRRIMDSYHVNMGKLGIWLRSLSPKVYFRLKKMKDSIEGGPRTLNEN